MQRTTKILAAMAGPSILMATSLFAQTNLTATLDLSGGYRDDKSWGGEFTAVFSGNNGFSSYVLSHYNSNVSTTVGGQRGIETFCVEMNQYFNPTVPYNATVGPTIVNGQGNSALTVGVAWLYMEFVTGGLATAGNAYSLSAADYNYVTGPQRELCADELQDAIWYLQGELGPNGNGQTSDNTYTFAAGGRNADPFVLLVEDQFGSLGGAEQSDTAPGQSNYGVEVLNLTSQYNGSTVYDQDQLIYCPVPEPATWAAAAMLLVPLGLSGWRTLRNKSQSK